MRKFILAFCFLLAACASGGKVVTDETFHEIERGMTLSELKAKFGSPNEVKNLPSGDKEYIYLERIQGNDEIVEVREYIFIVSKDGRVIDKKMGFRKMPLPYQILRRNAFDLQTSQN